MIKTYLITFTPNSDNQDNIITRIREYPYWARINTNTWCIKIANMTVASIRDSLLNYCSKGDSLFVVEITNSAWASTRLHKEVTSWLKE